MRLQNEEGRPGVRRRMVDEFESGAQQMDGARLLVVVCCAQ